jgi:multiple sugar transport system permease protein
VARQSSELAATSRVGPRERAPTHPVASSRRHRRWGRNARSEALSGYTLVLPDLAGLVLFLVLPMALAVAFGFFKIDGFGQYTWSGFDNYRTMLHDDLLRQSAKVSLIYAGAFVPLVFACGLGLAC